jgi:hypothetical protein
MSGSTFPKLREEFDKFRSNFIIISKLEKKQKNKKTQKLI